MEQFWSWLIALACDIAAKLLASFVVFLVGRFLIKLVVKRLRNGKLRDKLEPTVMQFLLNFINIALYAVLTVTIVAIMGVPMASVIAVIASAGVAVGLALQGSLSNLAGGIMILIFRPFRVGDFIETVDDYMGTVKDIDIFYTTLNTPDNKVVAVPNGSVMASPIVNYSINDTRRLDIPISLAYGTDAEYVKKILLEEAAAHTLVKKDPEPFCRLTRQNTGTMDFTLRVWVGKDDYWTVNFDLTEAVDRRLKEEKLEVPSNQINVHMK